MSGTARFRKGTGVEFTLTPTLACLIAVLLGAIFSPVARADLATDRARGEQLAATHCAKCHAVGAAGESPQNRVPPFRALIAIYPVDMLVKSLSTGIISGHEEMPMRELGYTDARALLTYIDSLNPNGPKYITPGR
ncbi:MAG: c-type cytochrome [Hyphomicrobiaceae bacterium]